MTIIPNRALIDGQTCKVGGSLYVAIADLWIYNVNFFEQFEFDKALEFSVIRFSIIIERFIEKC